MAKLPAFQFYPGDWMKDPELRSCSIFARGLLVDILCLMHEANPRGHLCFDGEKPWSNSQIVAAICGNESIEDKMAGLNELLDRGVLKRNSAGIVYSARMVRDEKLRLERSKAGSKGGSKRQANAKQKSSKPQATTQAKTGSSSSSSSSSSDTRKAAFELWWLCVHLKTGKEGARKAYHKAIKRLKAELDDGRPEFVNPHAFLRERMTLFAQSPDANPPDREPIHPARWLNDGRYDDDPKAWGGNKREATTGPNPRDAELTRNMLRARIIKESREKGLDWDDDDVKRAIEAEMEKTQ